MPDEKTKTVENASPPIPTSAFEKQDVDSPAFRTPEILRLEDEREEMSDSSDMSACSATYSNLGKYLTSAQNVAWLLAGFTDNTRPEQY